MINLIIKRNQDVPSFYDFDIVVDTGTTVTTVCPGLLQKEDLEEILVDLQDQLEKILSKL